MPLDKRGYCIRDSVISYRPAAISYRPTMPPSTHPSTAPYALLNAHFNRHYKAGTMSRFIVQAILYPQMRREVDMNKVRMRRRHKTSIRMLRKKSTKNKTDDGEVTESSEDPEEEEEDYDDEQTETDESCGSTASNPFGLVHYFTGKRQTGGDRERTEYETFIDHCADCTKDVFEAVAKAKTDELKVVRDSKGNLCFTHFKDLEKIDDGLRDSMPFGSTAVQLQEQSRSNSRDVVHTTTAHIRINQLHDQPSEQLSSFDQGTNREANFEDLSKLDDSMPIKMGRRQRTILEERHSMPTLFVGNRFNSVSATKIYIPSWKDKQQDLQNSVTNCAEVGIESVDSARSGPPLPHSSSVDVPCDRVLPIPDKVVVELLYNMNESQSSAENEIFTPPRMFKNDTPALSRDVSPFAKHNLNSDKRVSSTSSNASTPSGAEKQKRNSRRCLTYQYVQLHSSDKTIIESRSTSDAQQNTTSGTSARSSDSGMAGSYTLPSPDPPKVADEFFYAYEFDHMPVDAAEQAGTSRNPPPAGLMHSQSTHNLGRVNMIVASREMDIESDDPGDVTDSGQYGDEGSLMKDFNEKYPFFNYEEPSISRGRTAIRGAEQTHRSRSAGQHRFSSFTDTIVINIGSPSVNMIRLGGAHAPSVEKSGEREDEASLQSGKEMVYRTGLYAHWWKKEKLPNALIKELMLKPNHGHGKSKKPCRRHTKHNQKEGASKGVSKSCQTSVSPPAEVVVVVAVNDDAKGSGKQRLVLWIGCD